MNAFDATLQAIRAAHIPGLPYADLVHSFKLACWAEALDKGGPEAMRQAIEADR